jgi:acyl-CoA reductase-like NAD-dependent aldehyde dehydrogenase
MANSDVLRVLEPATGGVLATIPAASIADTDAAVARARAAFPGWRAVSPSDRARVLRRLAEAVRGALEELAVLEARNAGKPIGDARGEMEMVAAVFDYYAGAPELTPLTALRCASLALESGLPEGVSNVVAGAGLTCGARLVEHPDVAKIAFTGSTAVGRGIARTAADTLKRVTLELAASRPTSCSPTRILRPPRRRRPGPCSATPGRTAVRAHGSSCCPRCSTSSWVGWGTR